jgi:hypothetical protein
VLDGIARNAKNDRNFACCRFCGESATFAAERDDGAHLPAHQLRCEFW